MAGTCLLMGSIGLWLSRKVHHAETHAGHKLAGNMELLGKSLDNILDRLESINRNKEELPTYEARFEIDRLFREERAYKRRGTTGSRRTCR